MDRTTLELGLGGAGEMVLGALAARQFPVLAAGWVKYAGRTGWRLVVVSNFVTNEGAKAAYLHAHRILGETSLTFDWRAALSLVSEANPTGRDVVRACPATFWETPQPVEVSTLGGVPVDAAYIYPPPATASTGFADLKRHFPSAVRFTLPIPREAVERNGHFRELAGQVNAASFEGRAPETVLFSGAESNSGKARAKLVFIYRPEGWNTALHPETQEWTRIVLAGSGQPFYQPADFDPLEAAKGVAPDPMLPFLKRAAPTSAGVNLIEPVSNAVVKTFPPDRVDWDEVTRHMAGGGVITMRGRPTGESAPLDASHADANG